MKAFIWAVICYFLFPGVVFASDVSTYTGGLSFTPSAGDYSIIFLENIFGVVDGVLHGTGSQMMGHLLGVLNAAALTLGGVIIMYIILVSTLNTAHEGEMLGQRWSSIWIPMRAVGALALLLPKASGYCMMQIFTMWTVVQGVGVADKVWNVALDYLNRGGVIIQANLSASTSSSADEYNIISGGATMLYGQVCMYGLERQLENAHEQYMTQKNSGTGPCNGTPDATMQAFCDGSVPDFISTVDPVTYQQTDPDAADWTLKMPNFDPSSMYSKLNGMCGTIHWNALNTASLSGITTLSSSDIETIKLTRTLAVAQMYTGLTTTAKKMVENDPQLNLTLENDSSQNASKVAVDQFGVPLISSSSVCTGGDATCLLWGPDPSIDTTALLQGSELQDAVADYNGIMASTVKLLEDAENAESASEARAFIENAQHTGWIVAGSYFFDLVKLNGSAASSSNTDTNTGLESSDFQLSSGFMTAFDSDNCSGQYADLCHYLNKDASKAKAVQELIEGAEAKVEKPNFSVVDATSFLIYPGSTKSSTVYGYTSDSMNLDLSDQPSQTMVFELSPVHATAPSGNVDFDFGGDNNKCLGGKIFGSCLIKEKKLVHVGELIINGFVNFLIDAYSKAISGFFKYVLYYPIQGFATIFSKAIDLLNQEGVNPIAALGLMGISFVDFSMTTWLAVGMTVSLLSFMTPLLPVLMLFLPLFLGWIGAMLAIAFITAYYIPFLPYMLFTFGAIGWLISVIEMMVASPLLALGIMHPEGHDALGKGEQGLMMLCNVFLRPALMVIGFIVGIALSYVGVWIMQAGFQRVLNYLQGPGGWGASIMGWAQIYGYFFGCLMYVSMYLTIVQKAFTLIAVLPDRALTVLGVQASQIGQESSQWTEEAKGQMKEGSDAMKSAGSQTAKVMAGSAGEGVGAVRSGVKGLANFFKGSNVNIN